MALGLAFKTHERYMAREIYASTALVLVAFLMLFSFFDLIHEFESIGKGNYQVQHAVLYVALLVPGRIYELFPIAVLIGSLYALTQLARHSEITVLRASGASTPLFLVALAKIGMLFVLLTFLTGEFLVPPADKAAQQMRVKAMSAVVADEFRTGLWVKDDRAFVNVREVTPEAELRGIRIYQFGPDSTLLHISEAADGEFNAPDQWVFRNVVRTSFEGERARVENLADLHWTSALNPDILSVLLVVPERMSIDKLFRYIRHLSVNQQKTDRYEIALWKKLIYPLAALVMMALALPFAYLQDRMGAVSIKVFAGIMLGILFHMLNGLFSSLGIINEWLPFISAATPSLLFMLAAFGMLWMAERR